MKPRPLIAGNWKMNGRLRQLTELEHIAAAAPDAGKGRDLLICPPATILSASAGLLHGKAAVGGQDCHTEASGAHTGDIAAEMLADLGATYVIVGHSERRADHGESDAVVNAKATAAWRAGLTAIVCIGAVGAAVAVALPRGGLLVSVLVLPLAIPVLIFGVSATYGAVNEPDPFLPPFLILSALTLLFGALGPIAAGAALRAGAD